MAQETTRGDNRRSSSKNAGEVGRTGQGRGLDQRREGDGGEVLMGQSRGNVAIGRASGVAGTNTRAWSPSMQPLATEVTLRTSGPIRPPSNEQWGTPELEKTPRLAKGRI